MGHRVGSSDYQMVTNFFFEKCECFVVTIRVRHFFSEEQLRLSGIWWVYYFLWKKQMNGPNIFPQLSVKDLNMGSVKK